jgi:adenosylcobinamide-GDP ribazoletransferase
MSAAAVALGFLTRIPVPRRETLQAGSLARAAPWFPLVGAVVGAIAGGTRLLAELALPPEAATVLALTAAAIVTGGLHEDGLADTADGLGAHVGRERRLEIMRDPRVGTYGALALVLVTLLAWSLLATLSAVECLRAAVLGHVLSRWAMLVHARTTPPARPDGAGSLLRVTTARLAAATVVAAALATAAATEPATAAIAAAAVLLATLAFGRLTRSTLGGATGDTFGATGKLAEVAAYAAAVATISG